MTYKGKTITRHARGNWYVRLRAKGRIISLYGRTQMQVYEKLKAVCEIVEKEKFESKVSQITSKISIPQEISKSLGYTLMEWFNEWLKTYKLGNLRPSTIYGLKRDIKYLKGLHERYIKDITNMELAQAISEIKSDRTKDKAHNLIKQMFATAFNNGLIKINPSTHLPRPQQSAKFERKAFTQTQEKRFIETCMQDPKTYAPHLVCLLQGLRRGEMLALRPNDFDFERNLLRIDESYDMHFPEDLRTKNLASNRIMPMFELTQKVLILFKDLPPTQRIFENTSAETINRKLKQMLLLNGLPNITMHELRHTFITRCHEKGIDEIVVQSWVGHSKGSRMTKAVYTHVNKEHEQQFIDTMNQK